MKPKDQQQIKVGHISLIATVIARQALVLEIAKFPVEAILRDVYVGNS